MSTIGQAQIRESPPAKDRRPNHRATPPKWRQGTLVLKFLPMKNRTSSHSIFWF